MKTTLLEMVQDILSNMSSDEVNSIGDTTESLQIATIIRQKYLDIINRLDLPEHDQLVQLNPSLDSTVPVLMYVPEGISDIQWIKYFDSNTNASVSVSNHTTDIINGVPPINQTNPTPVSPPGYKYVTVLPNTQYIDYVNGFDPSSFDVEKFTFEDTSNKFNNAFTFYYKTDKTPQYCTILSNYYVIFDSFDTTQDSTLQASKTMALGSVLPVFNMVDNFVPDLAEEQFGLLLNESKALAFFELKQQPHQLAAKEIDRGWSSIQKKKSISNKPTYFDQTPDFGRKAMYNWKPSFKWR